MPRQLASYSAGGVIEKQNGCTVRYTGLALPHLPRRLKDAQKTAMEEVARKWREKFGPRHFEMQAFSRYAHREKDVYTKRKYDRRGGQARDDAGVKRKLPLVYSGDLKQDFLTGGMQIVSSGSGRSLKVKAVWKNLPRYTYYYKQGAKNQHNKVAELTITNKDEQKEMAKWFEQAVGKLIGAE